MTPKQIASWYWILPLLLLTWWLGARGLGADAIWWDEWRTIYRAGGDQDNLLSVPQVVQRMLDEDPNQSLGYPVLMAVWGRFVGWTDVAARAFSLVAGVPVVAVIYRLGKDMLGERGGLLAALVMGTSAFFISYLHELRTYSIYTLFAALAVWAYWHIISTRRITWLSGGGLALALAGMLYMHYLGAMLAAAVGFYHLFFVRKDRLWWGVVGLALVGVVLFTPWLGVLWAAVTAAVEEGGRPDVALSTWENLDQLLYALSNGLYLWFVPVVLGVPLAIARPTHPQERTAATFALFTFVVTLLLTLLLHQWLTILAHARYLLVLWVPFPLLVSIGTLRLAAAIPQTTRRYMLPAVTAFALVSVAWATVLPAFANTLLPPAYHVFFRPTLRWDAAGDLLKRETTATDAVAISIDRHPWAVQGAVNLYFNGMPARYATLDQLAASDDFDDAAAAFTAGAPRLWLLQEVDDSPPDMLATFLSTLPAQYAPCDQQEIGEGLRLDVYSVSEACCTAPAMPLVRYENVGITMEYTEILPTSSGSAVDVLTQWSVGRDVPVNTYSVALYVMDDDLTIHAQQDVPLPHDELICAQHSVPLADVPPGEYGLYATVYAWESGFRLPATHSDGTLSDLQRLASVQVGTR